MVILDGDISILYALLFYMIRFETLLFIDKVGGL